MVTVRDATAKDIPSLIRIERQSQTAAHWNEQQYDQLLRTDLSPRLSLVAEKSETWEIVGFLIARHVATEWELENIVVAEESRGKGIGTQLLLEFLRQAQQTNSDSVLLEVRESNASARCLYESVGFCQMGRRKSYYTAPLEDALLYTKDLRSRQVSF